MSRGRWLALALALHVHASTAAAAEPPADAAPEAEIEPEYRQCGEGEWCVFVPHEPRRNVNAYVVPMPMLLTSFGGGGALIGEGRTLGGDVMLGFQLRLMFPDERRPWLFMQPMFGWSGWRGIARVDPYLANAAVGRLDIGVRPGSKAFPMGFALSTAGRVGTARNADGRSLAYGGHAGVVWWVLMDAIGVELQLHMNDIAGARSYDDLRLVLTINFGQTIVLALFGMTL